MSILGWEGEGEMRPQFTSLCDFEARVAMPRVFHWEKREGFSPSAFQPTSLKPHQPGLMLKIRKTGILRNFILIDNIMLTDGKSPHL